MGLLDAADKLGKEVQEKRAADKQAQVIADQAKADAQKEAAQHEEDKKQGML